MVKLSYAALLAAFAFCPAGMAFAQPSATNSGGAISQAQWNTEHEIAQLKTQVNVLTNQVSDLKARDPQAQGAETFSNDNSFLEDPIVTGG